MQEPAALLLANAIPTEQDYFISKQQAMKKALGSNGE